MILQNKKQSRIARTDKIFMNGTLEKFVRRLIIETKYPKIRFTQLRDMIIKQQIKGVVNNAANKTIRILDKLQ